MQTGARLEDTETVSQTFTTTMTFRLLDMETPTPRCKAVDTLLVFLGEITARSNICHIQTILAVGVAELVARGQTQARPPYTKQLWALAGTAFHTGVRCLI
jgi:hypothetical protein